MQALIVLSAVLAVAVATPGYLGAPAAIAAPLAYAAPIHPGLAIHGPAPVAVRSDGYLLDTPEVAATRAAHLTAVGQIATRDAIIHGAAYAAHAAPLAVAAPLAYAAPGHLAASAHLAAKAALLG